MKTSDILRRAGRNLRQAKMRTILTSLAISVGAFTLTLSLAAGQGSRDYTNDLISTNIDPQALFIVKDKSIFEGGPTANTGLREFDADVTVRNGRSIKQLNQTDIDKLNKRNDLVDVTPVYQIDVQSISFEGSDKRYIAQVDTYRPGVKSEVIAGGLPEIGTDLKEGDVVIPESFAATLGIDASNLIGKTMTVTLAQVSQTPTDEEIQRILVTEGTAGLSKLAQGKTKEFDFTIRAIAKKASTALAATTSAQVSAMSAKQLNDYVTEGTTSYQKYFGVSATAKTGVDPAVVKAELNPEGYAAQTAQDLQSLLFTIVNILQGIVAGFGVLALLASVFGIINTQYISVLERTSQIGLMKALGMSGREIAKLFRYEAAWIGFIGGVIGAGIAWVLGTVANPLITRQLELGEGNYLLDFVWWQIAILLVSLVVIAIAAGYFPARKAAKLDPIEALRTE